MLIFIAGLDYISNFLIILKIIVIIIPFLYTIDEENPKGHAEEGNHVEVNVKEQEDHTGHVEEQDRLGHVEEQLIRPYGSY